MNKANQAIIQRFHFTWVTKILPRRRFKIDLIDSPKMKKDSRPAANPLQRFLIRLRSD
jgi:hypothetical protein